MEGDEKPTGDPALHDPHKDEAEQDSDTIELRDLSVPPSIHTVSDLTSNASLTRSPQTPTRQRAYTAHQKRHVAIGSLLYASSHGDTNSVYNTLRTGEVHVNDGDYDRRTALHVATSEGHFDLVKNLIDAHGADINAKDRWGGTPLDDAVRHGHEQISVYLKQQGGQHGDSADFGAQLISAASRGDLAIVKKLVESGVSPNSADYDQRSALHVAVADRRLDVVQYLLSKGADPNAVDRFGGTPLDEARRVGVRLGTDDIQQVIEQAANKNIHHKKWYLRFLNPFAVTIFFFEMIFIALFAIFTRYDDLANGTTDASIQGDANIYVINYHHFFMDVHVMIFIGFGFLMTFLRKYGYTAVGVNFLLGTFALQWYILVGAFFEYCLEGHWEYIGINIVRLIKADFAAGAVLITFGALLGKTTPLQMCVVALFEVTVYAINEAVGIRLGVADLGGSMVIHTFGAYFGLAASLLLTPRGARGNSDNSAVYRSDLFSMIGTIFLWIYWPSFNAALGVGATQHRAVINTVLSISASCVITFVASNIIRGERVFNMVDIQNATLAGGVAMGAASDMIHHPAVALGVGTFAGLVSVFGFSRLQPFLERKIGLHDTCGVHNLHGMPGIIGAIAGISAAAWAPAGVYGLQLSVVFPDRPGRSAQSQALHQFAYLGITLGFAIVGGLLTGLFVRLIPRPKKFFVDDQHWEVPKLELPYYFDERGEIERIDRAIYNAKEENVVPAEVDARFAKMEAKIKKLKKRANRTGAYFLRCNF
eukprot:TRINITY_DN6345_c0_g1_i2.p1 TRINITY_DN6345_c0_g1~~TRINITY_DN6345_c0_g1_i2.p1  ORF type:complete len:781 (+),score=118.55 TRINITY_DN6345_c0_g1_i2:53-2344(+)